MSQQLLDDLHILAVRAEQRRVLGSAVNMYLGVKNAGYTVAEELPVAAGVFGGPALIALGLWWKLR